MLYIIAFLLLIIVLANETTRNILLSILLSFFGLSIILVLAAIVLIVVVILGYAAFTGKFTTVFVSVKSWFNKFVIEHPTISLIIMFGLLIIVAIDIIKHRQEMKQLSQKK